MLPNQNTIMIKFNIHNESHITAATAIICFALFVIYHLAGLFNMDATDGIEPREGATAFTLNAKNHLQGGSIFEKATPEQIAKARKELVADSETERDLVCLADNAYHEARGEGFDGMVAVSQVVINRTKSRLFPREICKVVYQPSQFSWTNGKNGKNGKEKRKREGDAWEEAYRAAKKALSGYRIPKIGDALFYHAVSVSPDWSVAMLNEGHHHVVLGGHVYIVKAGS